MWPKPKVTLYSRTDSHVASGVDFSDNFVVLYEELEFVCFSSSVFVNIKTNCCSRLCKLLLTRSRTL